MIEWPAPAKATEIHDALMRNEPVAPSDLAVAYLEPLTAWLQRANFNVDEDVCSTAAEDAILALIKNPTSFDPSKSSLDAFLRMSGSGDLKNALRAEFRHSTRRAHLELVEDSNFAGNTSWDHSDPADILEAKESAAVAKLRLLPATTVHSSFSERDTTVLGLILSGERRTSVFAEALGISHLPVEEQRTAVKRAKDRLKIKVKRATGDRHDEQP